MYYSLTFGKEKNTWADWGLIASSPPQIPPPQPNKNLVNIPGRHQGPIDLSRVPWGVLTYGRVTGTWNFVKKEEDRRSRIETYEIIRGWLNGKTTTVMTEDDPYHYYQGIFTVEEPTSDKNTVKIKIKFDLEPIRYNLDGTEDTSYLLA